MARQSCLFEFECRTVGGVIPLTNHEKLHEVIGREYAEIIAEDLGKFPSGRGWFNRAFIIEHDKEYDKGLENWDVKHCFQRNTWRIMKLLNRKGEVYDRIDVNRTFQSGVVTKFYHDYRKIKNARIEGDIFTVTTEDECQWTFDIVETHIDRCDMIKYDPSKHKEDLLIECLKLGLSEEDIEEVKRAASYFDIYTPERLIDTDCRLPEIIEKCGFTPRFRQDVPVLKPDFDYNPIDQKCSRCLFFDNKKCRKGMDSECWCSHWIWNRKPFSTKKSKKGAKPPEFQSSS